MEVAATRGGLTTLIDIAPGTYVTRGELDMPDGTLIRSVHRSVFLRPEPGYEQRNVIRMGSGCFIEGPVFENWRLDSLENPTVGFAISFRPGAVITRVPYAHKIVVRTNPYWTSVAPPLDRQNENPLIGIGGGVVLADGLVCSPYSVFPNIMTWGATPVTHNGIGYVAKNGALVNAVNAISLWCHKHFYAIDGGQIVLSSCSSQFGDYTMVAKGSRKLILPDDPIELPVIKQTAYSAVTAATPQIINRMWNSLVLEGYTTGWPAEYETLTRRDAASLLQAIGWTLQSANDKPISDFTKGLFDTQGNRSFVESPFSYSKSYRDAKYIHEAIKYDILFNSNFRTLTAAKAFYRVSSNVLMTAYKTELVYAITQQKEIAGSYLTGTSLTRSNALFNEVLDIVNNGESAANTIVISDPIAYDTGYLNARTLLVNNKEFIKDEIQYWIAENRTDIFAYDQAKCERDTGLIIDAASYDLLLGTNYNAVTAGLSYTRGTSSYLNTTQKTETIAALVDAKTRAIAITPLSTTAFDEVIDVLTNGASATDALTFPAVAGLTLGTAETSKDALVAAKATLQSAISTFVADNYPELALSYNQAKCERDTGIAINAAAYDLALGTNYNAVTTGLSYTRANTAYLQQEQKTETIAALQFARDQAAETITDATAAGLSNAAFNELVDILENGAGNANVLSFPAASYSTTDQQNAVAQLVANRSFLQTEILKYIEDNFPVVYAAMDTAKCSRDVGYIIDALCYDVMYGGNSASVIAAEAYFVGTVSQLGAGQQEATVAAYNYLGSAVGFVIREITGWNIVGTQNTTGTAATITEATTAGTGIDIIKNVIQAGNLNNLPAVINPTIDNEGNFNSATELFAARASIITATINFIETTFPTLIYGRVKCERDVGYIIDALCYDIMYGGNSASIQAAKTYFFGAVSQLGAGEEAATIASYNQLITLVQAEVEAAEDARVATLLGYTISVITDGNTNALPEPIYPVKTDLANESAFNSLQAARQTLINDTITFINTTYNIYDVQKCKRDVGYIVDALRYDLTYGGNLETYNVASAYFVGALTQYGSGEKEGTIAAYERLRSILGDILQGISITPSIGNRLVQDTSGTPGSTAAAAFANIRVSEIVATLSNNGILPTIITPDRTWTDEQYQTSFTLLTTNTRNIINLVMRNLMKEAKTLFGAFIHGHETIRDQILLLTEVDTEAANIVTSQIESLINTLLDPAKVTEPSTITAIGHTWTGIMAGVALTKLPPARNFATIAESILELEQGLVIASGQDDQGSALFIGGMEINSDTGELTGPPFEKSVNRIATRTSIARSF